MQLGQSTAIKYAKSFINAKKLWPNSTAKFSATHFPSVLWHYWLGDKKGVWSVKKLGVGLLVVSIWLRLLAPFC